MECVLCFSRKTSPIKFSDQSEKYFNCEVCDLRFLDPIYYLSPDEERKRYELHENDINDLDYRNFLRPLYDFVCRTQPQGAYGLDYGAGCGPALAQMLKENGYEMELYDPFFWPEKNVLENRYDFIVLSEVAEHFHHPHKEFLLLKKLLRHKGRLGIMTLLYQEGIGFEEWYYRKDPTHVCFYSAQTFNWMMSNFRLKSFNIQSDRLITIES